MNTKFTIVSIILAVMIAAHVSAVYDNPWAPNWQNEDGYTLQFWSFLPVEDQEPASPLAADVYGYNSYGDAAVAWTNHGGGMVGWQAAIMGTHPDWAIGAYGGMVNMAGGFFDLSATIPTGEAEGAVKVFIQYDWYAYSGANLWATVENGVDITPQNYYSYEIAKSGSNQPWMRSTQVFELPSNTGEVDISFGASGFVTAVDSLCVATAVGASLPSEPLRHSNDYDLDGIVGLGDFAIWAKSWLEESVYGFWHIE